MTDASASRARVDERWIGFLLLIVTAGGWALNFTAVKILLRDWPPLFARGLAGVVASILLAILAACLGQRLAVPRAAMPRLLFAAFTNVFALMGFSTLSLRWLPVGESLLLIYTMPIWSTLFAWPLLGARPSLQGLLSLLLGTAGVVVLIGRQGIALDVGQLWGVALALGAAVLFGLGGVLNQRPLPIPIIVSTAWQVALGCGPMLFLGVCFEHPILGALTRTGAWIMVYMTLVAMGLCYLTWFATLRRLPAPTAATGMLLVPVIGVFSAAGVLGEPLGARQFVALALTLTGVALALRESPSVR